MKNSFKQVSIRLNDEASLMSDKALNNPKDIVEELASQIFTKLDKEELCVINFNKEMKPINFYIASVGTLSESVMHPRELLKSSILSNAAKVVILHNHPSGSLEPSFQDINTTRQIVTAFNLLNISVLDHIIIGGQNTKEYFSFKQNEVIEFDNLKIFEDGLINYGNMEDVITRNINIFKMSDELTFWQNRNSLTISLNDEEASLLLDFEDMLGFSLAVENDELVKVNNKDDNAPTITECNLEQEIYNLCDYIQDQIKEIGAKRDNPVNFNEFCYAAEEYDKLITMENTAQGLFSKTTLGKNFELGNIVEEDTIHKEVKR